MKSVINIISNTRKYVGAILEKNRKTVPLSIMHELFVLSIKEISSRLNVALFVKVFYRPSW